MTDGTPAVPDRQVPLSAILDRYRNELAEKTQALFVAQATVDAAEAECSALRLRLADLEDATR